MGKVFFVDWELWQKMTFVLACGIVLVFIGGLIKLQFSNWKIRKYSKVQKGKATQTPEMLEAQREEEEEKNQIPFGIRAIESGIEVDGVWISRSNTPVGSSASSINESRLNLPKFGNGTGSNNSSQLELPQPIHGSSSRTSSRAPSSAFDRAVSAERLPDSRSSSPGYNNGEQRGRQPSASQSRYSNPNMLRNSTTLQALEGYGSGSGSYELQGLNGSTSSKSSRNSDESDYMHLSHVQDGRPYEAAYINPRQSNLAIPADPKFAQLDLLQSHRMSHVAETGQLTPRVRRPGNSGEWASVANNVVSPEQRASAQGVDYFVPRQKTPSPPLPVSYLNALEDYSSNSAATSTQDSHASNEARQAVPLLETYQPRGPHDYEEEAAGHPYAMATIQNQPENQRHDPVLRKVNSGFEILRPGTFNINTSPTEDDEEAGRVEKRHSKKLQKKRRNSSSASKTSHFVEQI